MLARPRRASDTAARTHIPDTIFYQHGSLRMWFANDTGENGEVIKRDKRDCTNDRIMDILGAAAPPGAVSDGMAQSAASSALARQWVRRAASGEEGPLPPAPERLPVASYMVYQAPQRPSAAVGRNTEANLSGFVDSTGEPLDELSTHYMDRNGLHHFLENSRAPRHNALLQRFPHGRNERHTTFSVVWSPYQTNIHQRQNLHIMTDASIPIFERCCTAESFAHLSKEMNTTPHVRGILTAECKSIVDHIAAVESRHVVRMAAVFAFSESRQPLLLYCTEVQLTSAPMPLTDVKAGLVRCYNRNLVSIAPPMRNGLHAILAAGGGITLEDAQGAPKSRSSSRLRLKYTVHKSLAESIAQVNDVDRFSKHYEALGGRIEVGTPFRCRTSDANEHGRRSRMLQPRLLVDASPVGPDEHDHRYPRDAVADDVARGAGSVVSAVSGQRSALVLQTDVRAHSSTAGRWTPSQLSNSASSRAGGQTLRPQSALQRIRYSGGGGGGFFVQPGRRSASGAASAVARGQNRSPNSLHASFADEADDILSCTTVPHDGGASWVGTQHRGRGEESGNGADAAFRRWKQLSTRLPPNVSEAVERVREQYRDAIAATEDFVLALDTLSSSIPRDSEAPVHVRLPESLVALQQRDDHVDAALTRVVLRLATARPLSLRLGSADESSLALQATPQNDAVLKAFAAEESGASASTKGPVLRVAAAVGKDDTELGEEEQAMSTVITTVDIPGGWHGMRSCLVRVRGAVQTMKAAQVYAEIALLLPLASAKGTRTLLATYFSALRTTAGSVEWPPRWAVVATA
jgi:hypothetical protein